MSAVPSSTADAPLAAQARSAATPQSTREERYFGIALALVALLPRLFVAIAWAREPVWDGHYYHFGAERIAEGFGYSEDVIVNGETVTKPWVHYPVGYSGLLAMVYRIFGSGLLVAPLVNAVIGTLLVVVAYVTARHYLSPGRSKVAGALVALHPGLIAYSAVVMNEPLAALLLMSAIAAIVVWRGQGKGVVVSGLAFGLAALVRPSTLLVVPLVLLALPGRTSERLGKTLVLGALSLVVLLPWTIRNCTVMDGCALVSTNGGWNLAIGALTETGRFRTLRAADGCAVVTGQVHQDRCWAEVGLRTIREGPGKWLGLVPKKLAHTFNHESFAVEYLREADPASWPEHRRVAGRHLLSWLHRFLLVAAALSVVARPVLGAPRRPGTRPQEARPRETAVQLGLLGLVTGTAVFATFSIEHPFYLFAVATPLLGLLCLPGAPRQGPTGRLLLGAVLATCVTHAVFFGDDRYHLVITPALCLLAAAALRPGRDSVPAPNSEATNGSPSPVAPAGA